MKIMIDIGHGGNDNGATGNGLIEKNLNLTVGLKIRDYLTQKYNVEVAVTRDKDISLTNDERIAIIKKFDPDLCVSVHHNSADIPNARGAEVIHAHYDKTDDELAYDILHRLAKLGMPIRRAFSKLNLNKVDWYYIIRRVYNSATQVIITEGGFISNKEDAALLKNAGFIEAESIAIADAIAVFLKLEAKQQEPVNTPHWGQAAVQKLKDRGLISVDHAPDEQVTWAEFATVIGRLEKLNS
jgi:N-acetylmuramoyl-L-alanine amidase